MTLLIYPLEQTACVSLGPCIDPALDDVAHLSYLASNPPPNNFKRNKCHYYSLTVLNLRWCQLDINEGRESGLSAIPSFTSIGGSASGRRPGDDMGPVGDMKGELVLRAGLQLSHLNRGGAGGEGDRPGELGGVDPQCVQLHCSL